MQAYGCFSEGFCVRNQGIFPAPEEIISPFAKAQFVGGDARGPHVMPLTPVPINTPVTGIYCLPIVSCAGFSIDKGRPLFRVLYRFLRQPGVGRGPPARPAQSYRDAQPGLVWRCNAALFRTGVWRLPRHRVRTAQALSAAPGAQAGSGRIETAYNQKLRVTVTVHFIESMIVLWRHAWSACETPRASAS